MEIRKDTIAENKGSTDKQWNEKSGFCSEYAHMCGHIDRFTTRTHQLDHYKDGVYHVKLIELDEEGRFKRRIGWMSYDSRTDSKKEFLEVRRLLQTIAKSENRVKEIFN